MGLKWVRFNYRQIGPLKRTRYWFSKEPAMKTRESGMPDEDRWISFFDPGFILGELGLNQSCQCVVDLGCGYGTFSIPAARRITGTVYAMDINPKMVDACQAK